MKNWVIVVIGIVLGISTLLIFGYVSLIIYINWPDDKTIVKKLQVTKEWTEVAIDPSVKPTKQSQYIKLRINDFKVDRSSNSFDIILPDGTIIEPEIELHDEFGNKFEFHHSGFAMKTYDDIVFTPGPLKQLMELPADRQYTKLRIRSDVPFLCDQIYWRDYNLK